MIGSDRLKDYGLDPSKDYRLEVPPKWFGADIGAEEWHGKRVKIVNTNCQAVFWVEIKAFDLKSNVLFAAEPSWLKSFCSCSIEMLMYRGCQCGGL